MPELAELVVLAASNRSRACTSAGPAEDSTTSETPHSGQIATMPPSVTIARMETARPSAPSNLHNVRAAAKSCRASSSSRSYGPEVTNEAASGGADRIRTGSRSTAGNTDAGVGSVVSSRSSIHLLLICASPTERVYLRGVRRRAEQRATAGSRADMMSISVPEISGSCERRVTASVSQAGDGGHVTVLRPESTTTLT